MADTGIFATTAEIVAKAGQGASSTYAAEAYTNMYIAQAESYINAYCKFNFSDTYSSLNADVKGVIKEIASNIAAGYVVIQDMSGYFSLAEAQTLVNYLWDRAEKILNILKDKDVTSFISGA